MVNQPLRIYLFCCSNSFNTDDLVRRFRELGVDELKVIGIPCSGKVDILYLIKAFESGADGVVMITCKQDECSYLEGNLRARKRAEAVDSLLEEIGLNRGRIAVIELGEGGVEKVICEVENFCSRIKNLPQQAAERSQLFRSSAALSRVGCS